MLENNILITLKNAINFFLSLLLIQCNNVIKMNGWLYGCFSPYNAKHFNSNQNVFNIKIFLKCLQESKQNDEERERKREKKTLCYIFFHSG